MTRALPTLVLGLALACAQDHTGRVDITAGSCVSCHRADYQGATDPVHAGTFPETCDDCHVTAAWMPALEGPHPNAIFPITTGDHAPFRCLECHDTALGASAAGMNTNCVDCHTGAHLASLMAGVHGGVGDYAFDGQRKNFCLDCHPDGRAPHHPNDRFLISSGPHSEFTCGDCHKAALGPSTGGMNADCIGCHTGAHSQAKMADKHQEVPQYDWDPANPDFCRACHPTGRE